MLIEDKKMYIIDLLKRENSVKVDELSIALNTSNVTIRKILNELDHDGLVKRTRGGAVAITNYVKEFEQKEKENKNTKEKKSIAQAAYEHIKDGESILLDAGSTTDELAQLIKTGKKRNLIVATNAINIVAQLIDADDIKLIVLGGDFRHKILSCVGPMTENALKGLCFDKAFIGANNIDLDKGICTPNIAEANVKRSMMNASQEVIVLADNSKFGTTSLSIVCSLSDINCIITDWNASDTFLNKVKDLGVEVIKTAE